MSGDTEAIEREFEQRFGRRPTAVMEAPGRVNLIGEHTDYNDGFVLPMPIPQRCRVALAPRPDRQVRLLSREEPSEHPVAYGLGQERAVGGWLDYPQGATSELSASGYKISGFEGLVESDVPMGAGLSSSAALDVALLRALRVAFGLDLDNLALALVAQRAEHAFAGAMVGAMDPIVSSLGEPGSALFLDTRSLACELVPLPACLEVVVIDSGVRHQIAGGDYNTRRRECERARELLGVAALRDVSVAELGRVDALPEPLNRRARHVVTEDERVLEAVEALRGGDCERVGRLLDASHVSLRDLYTVSTPEVDRLVALAQVDSRCLGARLTGGGFGGSIVLLSRPGTGGAVAADVVAAYGAATGRQASVLILDDEGQKLAPKPSRPARNDPRY